jgi:hypothetical protein
MLLSVLVTLKGWLMVEEDMQRPAQFLGGEGFRQQHHGSS